MKSILMSIQPQYVAKILNGEKLIEIRKRFPKDYHGWVYIYCTKEKETLAINPYGGYAIVPNKYGNEYFNGKIIARFYCDNVEKLDIWKDDLEEKLKPACLSVLEFNEYRKGKVAYAIHISQLEIFDKPKDISEFYRASCEKCPIKNSKACFDHCGEDICKIAKAPQNWCYVEELE